MALYQGEQAASSFASALEIYRSLGDAAGTAYTLLMLGMEAEDRGAYDRAASLLAEARALSVSAKDASMDAVTCYHHGVVAWGQGDPARAIAHLEEARRLAHAAGSTFVVGWADGRLSVIACEQGNHARATALLRDGMTRQQASWDLHAQSDLLALAGVLAEARDEAGRAARWFGANDALCAMMGIIERLPERAVYERATTAARAALGEEDFAANWEAGRRLTLDEATAEVRGWAAAIPVDRPPTVA